MNKTALSQLGSFTGTENYYRYMTMLITDGVKYLIENADCYWLLSIIWSFQDKAHQDSMLRNMQFWHLRPCAKPESAAPFTVGTVMQITGKLPAQKPYSLKGRVIHHERCEGYPGAYVVCERDSDNAAIVQDIHYTNFPFDAVPNPTIWVAPTQTESGKIVQVAYLPSEH